MAVDDFNLYLYVLYLINAHVVFMHAWGLKANYFKEKFEDIPKGYSKAINQKTDNTTARRLSIV